MTKSKGGKDVDYTDEEAQRRFEATLKGALNTPPKHKTAAADQSAARTRPKPKGRKAG